jgi:hypothetical protein
LSSTPRPTAAGRGKTLACGQASARRPCSSERFTPAHHRALARPCR